MYEDYEGMWNTDPEKMSESQRKGFEFIQDLSDNQISELIVACFIELAQRDETTVLEEAEYALIGLQAVYRIVGKLPQPLLDWKDDS